MKSSLRVAILVLAEEARRRMPPESFRLTTTWGDKTLDIVVAPHVTWRWAEPCLSASHRGADGDVLGRFENQNGRFKAVRTDSGVAVVPDDLPPRADGC